MSIQQAPNRVVASPLGDDALAAKIANNFQDEPEDFQQASKLYDSTFFEGESAELRAKICKALKNRFTKFQNNYWNKWAR